MERKKGIAKKVSCDLWVDEITKKKMKPYRSGLSCMLNLKDFGISGFLTTSKERAEAYEYFAGKLIQILDTIPIPLIMHDKKFRITRANQAYLDLTGKKCKEIIGKYYGEIFPEDAADPPKCVCMLPRQIKYQNKYFKIYSFPMEDPKLQCYQASLHLFEDVTSQVMVEEKLGYTEERLRDSLIKTIKVMALTLEQRDPYTSGHQKRVAQLAEAIARDMGLSDQQILAVQLGGVVHDIGKVQVPSDILSKTGKLRDQEMELIRLHPEIGASIIKNIELPWPIKEIILQHHERLDGSGYPRKLKGKDIALESKILAVADVVEAMSSHRPYRPALGVGAALKEIQANAGKYYDAAVVKSCVKLFKKKHFKFSDG